MSQARDASPPAAGHSGSADRAGTDPGAQADRREFLLKLARTGVYAAPVIRTLAAPSSVSGQAPLSQKMMMMNMGMMMGGDAFTPFATDRALPAAPWGGDE